MFREEHASTGDAGGDSLAYSPPGVNEEKELQQLDFDASISNSNTNAYRQKERTNLMDLNIADFILMDCDDEEDGSQPLNPVVCNSDSEIKEKGSIPRPQVTPNETSAQVPSKSNCLNNLSQDTQATSEGIENASGLISGPSAPPQQLQQPDVPVQNETSSSDSHQSSFPPRTSCDIDEGGSSIRPVTGTAACAFQMYAFGNARPINKSTHTINAFPIQHPGSDQPSHVRITTTGACVHIPSSIAIGTTSNDQSELVTTGPNQNPGYGPTNINNKLPGNFGTPSSIHQQQQQQYRCFTTDPQLHSQFLQYAQKFPLYQENKESISTALPSVSDNRSSIQPSLVAVAEHSKSNVPVNSVNPVNRPPLQLQGQVHNMQPSRSECRYPSPFSNTLPTSTIVSTPYTTSSSIVQQRFVHPNSIPHGPQYQHSSFASCSFANSSNNVPVNNNNKHPYNNTKIPETYMPKVSASSDNPGQLAKYSPAIVEGNGSGINYQQVTTSTVSYNSSPHNPTSLSSPQPTHQYQQTMAMRKEYPSCYFDNRTRLPLIRPGITTADATPRYNSQTLHSYNGATGPPSAPAPVVAATLATTTPRNHYLGNFIVGAPSSVTGIPQPQSALCQQQLPKTFSSGALNSYMNIETNKTSPMGGRGDIVIPVRHLNANVRPTNQSSHASFLGHPVTSSDSLHQQNLSTTRDAQAHSSTAAVAVVVGGPTSTSGVRNLIPFHGASNFRHSQHQQQGTISII